MAYDAFREACNEANPVLLVPVMSLTITTPNGVHGRYHQRSEQQKMPGSNVSSKDRITVIEAHAPFIKDVRIFDGCTVPLAGQGILYDVFFALQYKINNDKIGEVLVFLRESRDYVSGDLSRQDSAYRRTAVWKYINHLERLVHSFQKSKGKRYETFSRKDLFVKLYAWEIERHLRMRYDGQKGNPQGKHRFHEYPCIQARPVR